MNQKKSIIRMILNENGWEITDTRPRNLLRPSEQILKDLGLTINAWNKVLDGEQEITLLQAKIISNWLKIPFARFEELIEEKESVKLK